MTIISLIDSKFQPKAEDFSFDLNTVLASIVGVRVDVAKNAFTAGSLGVERAGHGVVIRDTSLVLTIGYLTIEAQTIWLIDKNGSAVPGHVLAYDQESGFSIIQALGILEAPPIPVGCSSDTSIGDTVILAGNGGLTSSVATYITEKKEFAGYWEYLIDEAIFTSPPHPFWGGAGLISENGDLLGIGSLFVQRSDYNSTFDGNMIVPIDLLLPIYDDLLAFGRVNSPPRPWLGTMVVDAPDVLTIAGVFPGGPGELAGLEPGDKLTAINGMPINTLATFFRRLWSLGNAGIFVTLSVTREEKTLDLKIKSADRNSFLLQPNVH